jgi:hypothetical protein
MKEGASETFTFPFSTPFPDPAPFIICSNLHFLSRAVHPVPFLEVYIAQIAAFPKECRPCNHYKDSPPSILT